MEQDQRKKYTVALRPEQVRALRARVKAAVAKCKADERIPSETSVLEQVIAEALRGSS